MFNYKCRILVLGAIFLIGCQTSNTQTEDSNKVSPNAAALTACKNNKGTMAQCFDTCGSALAPDQKCITACETNCQISFFEKCDPNSCHTKYTTLCEHNLDYCEHVLKATVASCESEKDICSSKRTSCCSK